MPSPVEACQAKYRFLKPTDAALAAMRATQEAEHKIRYYYCPCCEGYHLTKQPIDVSLEIREREQKRKSRRHGR